MEADTHRRGLVQGLEELALLELVEERRKVAS